MNDENTKKLSSLDWEKSTKSSYHLKVYFILLKRNNFVGYPWTEKLFQTLHDVFKIEKFRAKQLSAINASMEGHDVLLIMPTGAGKSLCYQLPALISDGCEKETKENNWKLPLKIDLSFSRNNISYLSIGFSNGRSNWFSGKAKHQSFKTECKFS